MTTDGVSPTPPTASQAAVARMRRVFGVTPEEEMRVGQVRAAREAQNLLSSCPPVVTSPSPEQLAQQRELEQKVLASEAGRGAVLIDTAGSLLSPPSSRLHRTTPPVGYRATPAGVLAPS